MKGLRLKIALLAIATLASSSECLVTCATEFCRGATPPCHRHRQSKNGPQQCTHPILAADMREPTVARADSPATVTVCHVAREYFQPAPQTPSGKHYQPAESPPDFPDNGLSTILRI